MGIDEKPNAKVLIEGNVGEFNYAEQGNIEVIQTNNQGKSNDLQKVEQELIELLKDTSLEYKDI
ncbi:hypothetical protein [Bacillus thuringiensis]|uniref:hypothetical protein n=1 Tax=Bacillus thuringiensis TaxID=1428 RepID=UPI0021B17A3A|nr:hypothetical protein [Bacillus thuringiensis]